MDAPDRLFSSLSAVAADAASGIPPDPSQTLTLGVEYSLVSVVYLMYMRRRPLRHAVPFAGEMAQVRLHYIVGT